MPDFSIEQRVVEAIAREAGQIMLAERARGFDVLYKAEHDVVTRVDRLVEDHIRAELGQIFPNDEFNGEERGVSGEGERVWLVDPIDGTQNFTQGIPVFCVSIGLAVHKELVVGVIYDPNRNEMFSAQRGCGAKLNGASIQSSSVDELKNAVLATGFPPPKPDIEIDNIPYFVRAVGQTRNVRRLGSAAIDLAYVACGRLDGFWEFNLSPWDTAAGFLLVEEAGGRVTDHQGHPYQVTAKGIVAGAAGIHGQMLTMLSQDER